MARVFLDVDPAMLHLPTSRPSGADPAKLQRHIAQFGTSTKGMPPLEVYRGTDGKLVVYNGVTRATRVAKFFPGQLVQVELMGTVNGPGGNTPTVGDKLP